jgi:hypothetical protein
MAERTLGRRELTFLLHVRRSDRAGLLVHAVRVAAGEVAGRQPLHVGDLGCDLGNP